MGIERCAHGNVVHVTEDRGDGSINDEAFDCSDCSLEAQIRAWPDAARIDMPTAMKRIKGRANPAVVAAFLKTLRD